MKTFTVQYTGNSTRYKNFKVEILANSEREAVEDVYQKLMDDNYFPKDDGTILDCSGHVIAEEDDVIIEHDGGSFWAEEEEEEKKGNFVVEVSKALDWAEGYLSDTNKVVEDIKEAATFATQEQAEDAAAYFNMAYGRKGTIYARVR